MRVVYYVTLILAFSPISWAQKGSLRRVSEFPGTDAGARIQACVDALPDNGGTCIFDLEGAQQVTHGGIQIGTASKAVLLQFLKGTKLDVTAKDGKDVFALFDNSGMVCDNVGAIMLKGTSCRIKVAPGASIHTLVTNGQKDGTQESLYIRGMFFQGDPQATVSEAAVLFTGVYVPTVVEDTTIYDFDGPLLELKSNAMPTAGNGVVQFRNVWLNGGDLPKAQPLVIEGLPAAGNSAISFFGGAIEHQGIGMAAARIDGGGGTLTNSVSFYSTYFENSTFTHDAAEVSRTDGEITLKTTSPHGLSVGTAVLIGSGEHLIRGTVLSIPSPTTFTIRKPAANAAPIQAKLRFGGTVGVLVRDAYNITIEQALFLGGGGIDAVRIEESVGGRTHDIHIRDSINAAYANGVNDTRTGKKLFAGATGHPTSMSAWESQP